MFTEGFFGRGKTLTSFAERLDLVALVAIELLYVGTVMWPENAVAWLCRPLALLIAATEVTYFLGAYLFQSNPSWGPVLWGCQGMRVMNAGLALGGVWVIANEDCARGIFEALRLYDTKIVLPALAELTLFVLCLCTLLTAGRPVWQFPLPDADYRRGGA